MASGLLDVPAFNKEALIRAIRTDQSGESTFPEFLQSTWESGVIWYQADFEKRVVTYGGANGETCEESYVEVAI